MLDIYAFYAIAALTIVSSLLIFAQRKLIHAVVALAAAFFASSIIFAILGQTLIAILQLIVFIGGLSTYMIVAVATEEKNSKMIRLPIFIITVVILGAGISMLLSYIPIPSAQASSPSFLNAASSAFQSQYPILYLIVILLFAITISGVLIIKKFVRLVV